MTGPHHYREAERYLADGYNGEGADVLIARAQVHATLALAAATALMVPKGSSEESLAWYEVAGTPQKQRSGKAMFGG